jgi:hypothetical protein
MNKILINKEKSIRVDTFKWQTSPNGNKFRLSGLKKNSQIPAKWLDNTWKWHWIYEFIYEDDKHFYIEIDYNNKFLHLTKK